MFNLAREKLDIHKQKKQNKKKKVIVGMSGGIDSSYVAYLLKKQGYQVEGFFMVNWDKVKNSEFNNIDLEEDICQQTKDYEDAQLMADLLDIPLHKVNLVDEYWDLVFTKFLEELEKGNTPNPDVWCNKHIKFDKFITKIEEVVGEFDYIATGHYARIIEENGEYFLARAKDYTKDQTYFLAEIKKEILGKVLFPLQDINKRDLREEAIKLNFPIANKKDSTGICFIGERNFPNFISNYIKENEGNIIDINTNKIIGKHKGALFYTIGQRKGLNLGGQQEAMFVVKKDIKNNIIYVGGEDNDLLFSKIISAKNFNLLINDNNFKINNLDVEIKVRHSIETHKAKIIEFDKSKETISVELYEKVKAATPGQELVIYFDDKVVGGGQII